MFSGTVVSISDVLFKISLLLQLLSQLGSAEWHDDFGPWVKATQGEPWPSPNTRTLEHGFYIINASDFRFHVVGETCDIVRDAIERYQAILKTEAQAAEKVASDRPQFTLPNDSVFHGILQELKIQLKNPCTENHDYWPHLYMNETYTLDIQPNNPAVLAADSVWGILRGIETFSQLVSPNGENANLKVRCQRIVDAPKLVHRGLLLDTSRHFFPLKDILLTLDAMSYNKFNVFHWHIVDDNSFPYESLKFPELSKKGAYHSSMIYKPDDVRTVINYARLRGIRVIPEFDTPGHTRSWGVAHPDFLTKCYDAIGNPTGRLGPMNPINPALYEFLEELFSELKKTFPDQYVHLGGDEVPFSCWESNPDIRAYMRAHNMSDNYAALESEYISKLLNITAGMQSNPIVWQEVFDNEVVLRNTTVVHVWKGQWQQEVARVLKAGHPTLLSTCWYLDQSGASWSWNGDWERLYKCDPLDFYGSDDPSIKHLLLGGEACMWGEFVDRTNVHSRIWPRASAAIERLWSNFANITEAAHRLEEHACRMNRRGVPAQPPNGAGFCIV